MPRAREPSKAARLLIAQLAERDVAAGHRSIEDWAARGLAPGPIRKSLGRGRGMTSQYPPGAVDHYAAVAAVMRRGRPWQISVFKLLVRGYLPSDRDLLRHAYAELLAPPPTSPARDALDYAEQVASTTMGSATARPFLRVFERNLRQSRQVLEPGADITAAAAGVLATLVLLLTGQPEWSNGALIELMIAYGIPVGELSNDEQQALARFTTIFAEEVLSGQVLARVAAEAPPERIQAAIPWARETTREILGSIGRSFPQPGEDVEDMLIAVSALLRVRIDDLGGDDAITALASATLPDQAASSPLTVVVAGDRRTQSPPTIVGT